MMRTHSPETTRAFDQPSEGPARLIVQGNRANPMPVLRMFAPNVQDLAVKIDVPETNATHLAIRSRSRKRQQRIPVNELPLFPARRHLQERLLFLWRHRSRHISLLRLEALVAFVELMGPGARPLHDAPQCPQFLIDLVCAASLGALPLVLSQQSDIELIQRYRSKHAIECSDVLLQVRQRARRDITSPARWRHRARIQPQVGSFGKGKVWVE